MDIHQLEYILVLAETGNMTRAAARLYISQPTLSQFLARQEQELGVPLFQRSGGLYTLTSVGELYAEYARKVISLTSILEKDIKRISTTSNISIGTSSTRAMQMLSSILVDFRKYYPRVEIKVSTDNLRIMSGAVSRGEVDIAFITADSLEQYKGHSIELKKEEVVFVAPNSHPYCQTLEPGTGHTLTSEELLKHFGATPFILQLKGSCIRYLIDGFFGKQDFNPAIACSTSHAQSISDMVSSNIGVGFVPTGYAAALPDITYFSLEPKLYRIHSIIYRKDLIMEPPHKYLIQLAMEYAKENWQNLYNL